MFVFFFVQAEDGIRDVAVTGVQTCALPILAALARAAHRAGRPAGGAVHRLPRGRGVGARSLGACLPDRGSRARRHDGPDALGDPAEEWIRERRGAGTLGSRHPRSRRPERGPGDGAVAPGWDLRPPDPPAYPRGGGDPAPSVRGTQEGHRADVQPPDEPPPAAALLPPPTGSARPR